MRENYMTTERFKVRTKFNPPSNHRLVLHDDVFPQTDVISLFPMEVFYYFTGVNSLLRFPRLLKVAIFVRHFIRQHI